MSELELIQAELARRELARRDYRQYLPYVHGSMWKKTRMSDYIAYRVQEFLTTDTGNAYDILVVKTPPQHGKSMTLSETLPSWYMGRFPTKRVIMASYNEDSAQRFCRRNADKIRNFGATLFGVSLAIDRSTEIELNNRVGRMISRGIMSGITGNPADLIIIDDPIKNREEANSQTIRDKLWEEWQNSIKSRLAAGAKVILIMTPWHEDDLAARLLQSETNISEIRLPVEAEENDPLGRRIGDALCPELGKDNNWLKQFKASYIHDAQGGARAWEALYMCRPRVEGGNLVDRSWWQYYKEGSIRDFGTEVISVDAAFKGTDSSDYVCITVWGKLNTDYYLRYCLNRHLTFSQTLESIRLAQQLYPNAQRVLIEDKANGTAIIDVLQKEMFCIPVNPKGGKEARVNAISPAIESGHVFLPEGAAWLDAYLDQFSAFPAGAHDDMVDSTSQALAFLLQANGTPVNRTPDPEIAMTQFAERAFLDNDSLYDVYNDKRGVDYE
jgi:predicted phage terminase large subunit-like protein